MSTGVLLKPVLTEKMTSDSELLNVYGFIVDRKANKDQIKKAVETMYGVKVKAVRTMNYLGNNKRRHTKTTIQSGRTNHYKKAVVALVDGDTIDVFSSI
jgi:large subunit ribosomal protein L23